MKRPQSVYVGRPTPPRVSPLRKGVGPQKPELHQRSFNGSTANNIVLGLEDETGQGIETIACGVAWMDKRNTTPPAERFQMVAQGWDSRGAQQVEGEVTIWFSPDGKNWTTIGKKVDSSDTQVIPCPFHSTFGQSSMPYSRNLARLYIF